MTANRAASVRARLKQPTDASQQDFNLTLLPDVPAATLRTYPKATVVAEKMHAVTVLGMANTRMKDFFDLWVLLQDITLEDAELLRAIEATFDRRQTALLRARPIGLSDSFAKDAAKQLQRRAFLKKNKLDSMDLTDVVTATHRWPPLQRGNGRQAGHARDAHLNEPAGSLQAKEKRMTSSITSTPLGAQPLFRKPTGVRLGIGLTSPSPELAQICAYSGFDLVLIDMEHGPISIESAYRMVSALSGTAAEAWIRVTHNDVAQIKLALDTGATTVVVPMICTKAEAESAVAASKYPPRGIRGWGPFRPQYQWRTNMLDYAGRADAETQLVALIEHPRAIENIDEILAVEGLGGAIAAPFDLAVNMGFTDGPNHPEVQEALAHVSKKIAAKGFPLTGFAVTPEQGRAALSRGVTVLFLGFDTMFVPAAVQNYLALLEPTGPSRNR